MKYSSKIFIPLLSFFLLINPVSAQTDSSTTETDKQLKAVKNTDQKKKVTKENLENQIPQTAGSWELQSFEFKKRGFYDEPVGAELYFQKPGESYRIEVDLVYDLGEKRLNRLKQRLLRMEKSLESDKIKRVDVEGRIVYQPVESQDSSIEAKKIKDDLFYVVRREDGAYSSVKGRKIITDHFLVSYETDVERNDKNSRVKDVKKAASDVFTILQAFDFDQLSALEPTPYIPPAITRPENFKTHYFRELNTVVGYAYPQKWTIKEATGTRKYRSSKVLVSKDFTDKDHLLYRSISEASRNEDVKFRLFADDNMVIWITGEYDMGDRWTKASFERTIQYTKTKLSDAKVIEPIAELHTMGYPAKYYTLAGKDAKGHSVIYKQIQFQEESGRVFSIHILRPAKVSTQKQENIKILVQSVVAEHDED